MKLQLLNSIRVIPGSAQNTYKPTHSTLNRTDLVRLSQNCNFWEGALLEVISSKTHPTHPNKAHSPGAGCKQFCPGGFNYLQRRRLSTTPLVFSLKQVQHYSKTHSRETKTALAKQHLDTSQFLGKGEAHKTSSFL